MVSPLAGIIDATPVPIAEKVKPVPAIIVPADGRVIVDDPLPTRNTMLPTDVPDNVALAPNTIPNETEMPRPIAQFVAPYFAITAPALVE